MTTITIKRGRPDAARDIDGARTAPRPPTGGPVAVVRAGAGREPALFLDHPGTKPTTTTSTNHARPPSAAPSIAELLSAAGEGNPAAWEEIIRRYGGLVRAKVRSFRLQDADALDAIQLTWLRLTENCHRIQSPDHLGGWLATTASRECLRILHQTKRTLYAAEAMTDNVIDPAIGPERHAIDTDTAQQLWNLVAELPPRGRNLLRALFTDNPPPYTEIAHTTGIPTGSIGPTRARALQQLRRMADERGLVHTN